MIQNLTTEGQYRFASHDYLVEEIERLKKEIFEKDKDIDQKDRSIRAAQEYVSQSTRTIAELKAKLEILSDGFAPSFETLDFVMALQRIVEHYKLKKGFGLEYEEGTWSFYLLGADS